jgi:S-adenosylmethionine hydrolase
MNTQIPTIGLLTDFGLEDVYVGVMKAVIAGICPLARVIDLSHAVQPQNIHQAAFLLVNAVRYFPPGTVFVVVVDPGVGSARRAVAMRAGGYTFVAPDNGVLSYVAAELASEPQVAVELVDPAYRLPVVSSTFHGRDIFAPVAAHLACGVSVEAMGPPLQDLVALSQPTLSLKRDALIGEVLHVDRFGNVITSVGRLAWTANGDLDLEVAFGVERGRRVQVPARADVELRGRVVGGISRTYAEVPHDMPLALLSSDGFLELAVRQGNAAEVFGAQVGDSVLVTLG